MKPEYSVDKLDHRVLRVNMDARAGWKQRFLLRSDAHHDNSHCDQALERRHLDEAVATGAGIIDCGDAHCAMQGKWDKRADQDQLREELRGNDYLSRLRRYMREFYAPYADNFVCLTPGNHETSVLERHGEDLTQSLAESLNCPHLAYQGYIGFKFTINKTKRQTLWLSYHHGYGGGGPVTRGVIQTNRMAVYLPDATFVFSGHTHDEYIVPIQRSRISSNGVPYLDEQLHLRAGGYKDEFSPGDGWHVRRGGPPKPKGAIWLEFSVTPESAESGRVVYEARRAK